MGRSFLHSDGEPALGEGTALYGRRREQVDSAEECAAPGDSSLVVNWYGRSQRRLREDTGSYPFRRIYLHYDEGEGQRRADRCSEGRHCRRRARIRAWHYRRSSERRIQAGRCSCAVV